MKISQKFISTSFFLLSTALILILNIYPTYFLAKKAAFGRTYALIHNNVQDYYFYQALMNQGANGHWSIYDPYTAEPSRPSIIFSYFTWAGKLSKLMNLPYAYTYHISRILTSVFFFVAAYRLILLLKLPHPNLTYLFFLFATPLFNGKTPFMYWWTGMDSVRRAAYLPHHMFGGFLLIVSVIFILRFFSSRNLKYLIFASLLSPLMAFIHTPSLIILLITIPSALFQYWLLNIRKFIENWNLIIGNYLYLFVYWIIGLLSLSYMVSQTNKGFPWNQYLLWERNLQYPLAKELIPALGILFPFSLLGIIISIASRKFDRIFVACWFAVPLLLIPAAGKLGMSNIRLIQGIPYLSLAILAIIGIEFLVNKIFANLRIGIYWIIGLLFLASSYHEIVWSVKDQIREYSPIFGNTYLDNRLFAAFNFINKNYPRKTVTVATFYAGNYLPVYTYTISYIGHSGYTNNLARKEPEVTAFFKSEMSPQDAKSFLMSNKITLIFQGPEEKILYQKPLYPDILKPVYDREEATIYELKK